MNVNVDEFGVYVFIQDSDGDVPNYNEFAKGNVLTLGDLVDYLPLDSDYYYEAEDNSVDGLPEVHVKVYAFAGEDGTLVGHIYFTLGVDCVQEAIDLIEGR